MTATLDLPLTIPLTAAQQQAVDAVLAERAALPGALLPVLHGVQDALGFIPPAALPVIARALNLSRAEVHGVVGFYHDFRREPAGRHRVKVCRAEACQSMGGAAMAAGVLDRLGLDWHGSTADGAVTVEPVYCLGLCACAPAAMIDDRVVGRVDAAKMGRILAEAGA